MSNYPPIHPGIMAHFLLKEEGYRCVEDEKYYDEARLVEVKKNGVVGWETILRLPLDFVYYGKGNVDYIIAYNLVKLLPFTTIDWWMSRQADYDAWHKWHIKNGNYPQQECNQGPRPYQDETPSEEIHTNFEVGTEIPPCSHKYPIQNFYKYHEDKFEPVVVEDEAVVSVTFEEKILLQKGSKYFFYSDNMIRALHAINRILEKDAKAGIINWFKFDDNSVVFTNVRSCIEKDKK